MTLNDYQKAALETAVYPAEFNTLYPALGMAGEAGEVADKVKKIIRDTQITRNEQGAINIEPQKATEIAKEVGDVLWYCATIAHDLGYSLENIAQMNIEKLQSRKARGVLGGSGDNR